LTNRYSVSIVGGMSREPEIVSLSQLCDYCDEYHGPTGAELDARARAISGYVGCPYYEDFRRTTDVDDEEIERDAFARHDRRLFG
jgi:hypothetical protein